VVRSRERGIDDRTDIVADRNFYVVNVRWTQKMQSQVAGRLTIIRVDGSAMD